MHFVTKAYNKRVRVISKFYASELRQDFQIIEHIVNLVDNSN